MNPFADTLSFLMRGGWPLYLFWLLLVGSFVIAAINFGRDPTQRTLADVWMWIARLVMGGMWWQQTLWKLPPTFTDNPDGVSGGLHYWIDMMVQGAAFDWHRVFVKDVVQPHFYFFAPQVYGMEVLIAISLMLGLFVPVGGALGALQAINLWLGLYRAPHEWSWAYAFLILLQITFAVLHAGRSLGIDALWSRQSQLGSGPTKMSARVRALLT